jgi:hypothetical protein
VKRRALPPLRVEPGRCITDAAGDVVLIGKRDIDDPERSAPLTPAGTDELVHELVHRYNGFAQAVDALKTVMRESSPQSVVSAVRALDLPRLYFHTRDLLKQLGVDTDEPGPPAVLSIPPAPADEAHEESWQAGWRAGFNAAFKVSE